MGTVRRRYMDEFKREALGLWQPDCRGAGDSRCAAAGLAQQKQAGSPQHPNTQAAIPPGGGDLAAENARLRRENERLRMERKILEKTLRIFSEPPK